MQSHALQLGFSIILELGQIWCAEDAQMREKLQSTTIHNYCTDHYCITIVLFESGEQLRSIFTNRCRDISNKENVLSRENESFHRIRFNHI